MDEEVHGFTAHNTSPINEMARAGTPYDVNGAEAHPASLHQLRHKHHSRHHHHHGKEKENIGKDGIDGQVQGWTSSQNVIEALPAPKRLSDPYDANGSHDSAHSLAQGRNIAEPAMEQYVHGLTYDMNVVEALPKIRKLYPYDVNGDLSINPGSFA